MIRIFSNRSSKRIMARLVANMAGNSDRGAREAPASGSIDPPPPREPRFGDLALAAVVQDTVGFLSADAREISVTIVPDIDPGPISAVTGSCWKTC